MSYKMSVFLAALALGFPIAPVVAGDTPDVPGAAQTLANRASDLTLYDCTVQTENSGVRHMGQVVNDVYREWMQHYTTSERGRLTTCVVVIEPAPRQLSRADAQVFLGESGHIVQKPLTRPVASQEGGVAAAESAKAQSTLLRGVAESDASERSNESSSENHASPVIRTAPQQLSSNALTESYALLDLGFANKSGTPPAVKAPEVVERAAAIGNDDRLRVGDKTAFPWFLIGQVIVTWKNGTQSVCTGTLVSSHVVLTAGQCAHNRERGGFASKASFAPGQGQTSLLANVTQPNGARYADYVETNSRWTQISGDQTIQTLDANSDYAVLYFNAPWGIATSYMPVVYDDKSVSAVNTAGYPTEIGGGGALNQDMTYSSGVETSRSINLLRLFQVREFSIDVSAGQNGAPFWTYDGVSRAITGVVSYGGDEVAGGVWFSAANKAIIRSFIEWIPGQPSPVYFPNRLHVAMAFPGGNNAADSYLRFYNPTAQAGTVIVTFMSGDTGQQLSNWTSPSLPPFSSKQIAISILEAQAAPPLNNGPKAQRYTLDIAASFPGYFQHVVWNREGASLTNLTGCGGEMSNDVVHMNNVHSSLITAYPSGIFVHNVGATAVDAIVGVYDSETGARLGGIRIPAVPPQASAVFHLDEVEAALGIIPVIGVGPYHYNIVQEGNFPGYLQHLVYNNAAGVITNMTAKCAFPLL